MIMPMQQQIGSVSGDHALEDRGIHQPLVTRGVADRRVVNQDDAEKVFILEFVEDRCEFRELLRSEPSGGEEGRGRHAG